MQELIIVPHADADRLDLRIAHCQPNRPLHFPRNLAILYATNMRSGAVAPAPVRLAQLPSRFVQLPFVIG